MGCMHLLLNCNLTVNNSHRQITKDVNNKHRDMLPPPPFNQCEQCSRHNAITNTHPTSYTGHRALQQLQKRRKHMPPLCCVQHHTQGCGASTGYVIRRSHGYGMDEQNTHAMAAAANPATVPWLTHSLLQPSANGYMESCGSAPLSH